MKTIAENRKALALYDFRTKIEAGIKLLGPEVKSVRLGKVKLTGSYVKIIKGKPMVVGLRISVYPKAFEKHKLDPLRTRFLLLRRKEISKLAGLASQKGIAIVPLRMYLKNNLIKLEIGVGRGLKKFDKREKLKKKQAERQVQRALRGKY